jgi:cytochrome c peroxidase
MRSWGLGASLLAVALHAGCSEDPGSSPTRPRPHPEDDAGVVAPDPLQDAGASADYPLPLPKGFPKPYVPPDNPVTAEKAALGRHLFYDVRLSGNGTQSCASCHEQARAFTDGRKVGVGSTGQAHPRNSMTLANVAYVATQTWANPLLRTLESQAPVPMFGLDPIIELGIKGKEAEVMARLRAEPRYAPLFAAAFPTQQDPRQTDPFTFDNIVLALATFQRTLISGRSRFDRYQYDTEFDALTAQEKRGMALFESEALECFHCHGGFNFSDAVIHQNAPISNRKFHNTGLYNLDGRGAFPLENRGLIEFTGVASDMGKFRAPTLRNIEKTAPYMHDGSIDTLEAVVDHYAAGGRTIPTGPFAGDGSKNPYKSGFIVSFNISQEDKAALVAFLKSLTDEEFLTNPAFSDPWR